MSMINIKINFIENTLHKKITIFKNVTRIIFLSKLKVNKLKVIKLASNVLKVRKMMIVVGIGP